MPFLYATTNMIIKINCYVWLFGCLVVWLFGCLVVLELVILLLLKYL